jgi:DNA-binding NarL/FixJ family response regulator
MHECDVPSCINPFHLKLGTHLENMADCSRKGRSRTGRDGNGVKKIFDEDSREIARLVAAGVSKSQVARQYGVTTTCIRWHVKRHADAQ